MIGCRLMMWRYNTQNHHTLGNIPYHLVFGQLPCVGIFALPLDASVLTQLATEAQLNCVCNYIGKVNVLDNNTAAVEAIDIAEEAETANNNKIQANTTTLLSMSLWQWLTTLTILTLPVRQMTTYMRPQ
jgi:hypothetical protein